MIVYKLTNGIASDIRYEEDKYVLQPGERSIAGWDTLPTPDELSDPLKVAERDAAKATEEQRRRSLTTDQIAAELVAKLQTATPTDINTFVDSNVTDLASARKMFKRILLVLASQY